MIIRICINTLPKLQTQLASAMFWQWAIFWNKDKNYFDRNLAIIEFEEKQGTWQSNYFLKINLAVISEAAFVSQPFSSEPHLSVVTISISIIASGNLPP